MSCYFFLRAKLLYRSFLPGHLRWHSDFRDQLVVPTLRRKLVLNSRHDFPASGGRLAFKGNFDKVRGRYWWPTMHTDVRQHVDDSLSCQHRKTSRRPPKLPVGRRPVTRSVQCVAVDLVEYKSVSEGNQHILSAIDHLTRFSILIAIRSKEATTIVRNLVELTRSMRFLYSDHQTLFIQTKVWNLIITLSKGYKCLRI